MAADFNRNGYPDLYITSERVNVLLWNNGDGTFTEGAEQAGVDIGRKRAWKVGRQKIQGKSHRLVPVAIGRDSKLEWMLPKEKRLDQRGQ